MSTPAASFSRSGFVKSFVIPAFWVFLIPVCSLGVFRHVQAGFDRDVTANVVTAIQRDRSLTDERRTAMIADIRKCERGDESCAEDWQSRGWMPEEIVTVVTKPKSQK
jgi:hypothetical protein